MDSEIKILREEIDEYVKLIEAGEDGESLWENYQRVTSICMRLQQIHNDLAYMEIMGDASTEAKKFRTLIVDPTIERFDKLASFESRKITAKQLEWEMSRK